MIAEGWLQVAAVRESRLKNIAYWGTFLHPAERNFASGAFELWEIIIQQFSILVIIVKEKQHTCCSILMKRHGIEGPCTRLSKECAPRFDTIHESSQPSYLYICKNTAYLEILDRVTPSWYRPLQRMLTSGKRKKRPLFPWRSSSCSTTDTRLPYNIGGDWELPMYDPISNGVKPSPENNDKCAMRNGNSVSLDHN